jgi:hypothetical protein
MLPDPVPAAAPPEQVSSSESLGSIRKMSRRQYRVQPSERKKEGHYIIDLFSLEGEKCRSVL